MQKRIVNCPKCRNQVAVENANREAFVDVQCPNCKAKIRVAFDLAETEIRKEQVEDRTLIGHLRLDGKDYPLAEGKNVVGRYSSSDSVDVALRTADRTMSRKHCSIEVVRMKNGRCKAIIEELRDETKAQKSPLKISREKLLKGERIVLRDGDTIVMGETQVEYIQRREKQL